MFTPELTAPIGINQQTAWAEQFRSAVASAGSASPSTLDQALAAALAAWARGSAGLAADVAYRASERYCIRQSQLWQIYAAIEDRGLGAAISRTIFNRARDVVDETPLAAQPADRSFLEGENVIRKTLEHLRVVAAFYAGALQAGSGQENIAGPLPPSNGFQVLTALEATANPLQADALFRRFIADNQYVRGILLGDDATPAGRYSGRLLVRFRPGHRLGPGPLGEKPCAAARADFNLAGGAYPARLCPIARCIRVAAWKTHRRFDQNRTLQFHYGEPENRSGCPSRLSACWGKPLLNCYFFLRNTISHRRL
jgi:hypothetical protein